MATLTRTERQRFLAPPTVGALLPYLDFVDDAVILREGALGLGYRLRSLQTDGLNAEDLATGALRLRHALEALTPGLMLQILQVRQAGCGDLLRAHAALVPEGPDSLADHRARLARRLASQRAAHYEQLAAAGLLKRDTFYALAILPPAILLGENARQRHGLAGILGAGLSAVREALRGSAVGPAIRRTAAHHAGALRLLEAAGAQLDDALAHAGLDPARLRTAELFALCYDALNPARALRFPAPRYDAAAGPPREQLCYGDLAEDGRGILLDGLHHRVLTLRLAPEATVPAMAATLSDVGDDLYLSVAARAVPKGVALARLQQDQRRTAAQRLLPAYAGLVHADLRADVQHEEVATLQRELLQTSATLVETQLTLIVRGPTPEAAEEAADRALLALRALNGAEGLVERHAALPTFITALPFGARESQRLRRLKSENLAHLLPVYGGWAGHPRPVALFRARRGAAVGFDPFAGGGQAAWNAVVIGPTGTGKSFLVNYLLATALSLVPEVLIVDVGGESGSSYKRLVELLGGALVTFDLNAPLTINPFQLPQGAHHGPSPEQLAFLRGFLGLLVAEPGQPGVPRLEDSLIQRTLADYYAQPPAPGGEPTLGGYVGSLERCDGDDAAMARALAKKLYPWWGRGAYGRFFDGPQTFDPAHPVICFDLKGLGAHRDLLEAMTVLIIHYVTQLLARTGRDRPKLVIFDEAWALLARAASAAFVEEIYRRIRKDGGAAYAVTQNILDFVGTPVGQTILGNAAYKFLLGAGDHVGPLAQALSLEDEEIREIQDLRRRPGQFAECFLAAGDQRAVLQLWPTPHERWIFTTHPPDLARLEAALARGGGDTARAIEALVAEEASAAVPTNGRG